MHPKSSPEFRVFTVEPGQQIHAPKDSVEVRPVAVVVKPDGTMTDGPSLAFFFIDGKGGKWVGQIAAIHLEPALEILASLRKPPSPRRKKPTAH